MLSLILGALTTLGTAAITAYNKSKDVTVEGYKASVLAVQAQASVLIAELGHPFTPRNIMGYTVAIWLFKAVALDKVIGPVLGYAWYTDTLTGDVSTLANIIVSGLFLTGVADVISKRIFK